MISVLFLFLLVSLISINAFFVQPKLLRVKTSRDLFGSPEPKNTPAKKDGGGMFGGMGNLMESMKKAQEIAKQAEALNKELSETFVVGADPSGQVQATFNGSGSPISVKIADSILGQGSEAVSIAASQAVVDGFAKSQQLMITKMQALYAGAGVPGVPPTK